MGRCTHARQCPIAGIPCPGECIFANVLESENLGVFVFDLARSRVVFVNSAGRELLGRLGAQEDFPDLRALFLGSCSGPAGAHSDSAQSAQVGSRLVGYTRYHFGPYAWVFVRDITEKARFEAIAESVESMNNIGYVFAAVRHELGNPVNSVKAALSVLTSNLEKFSSENVAEYLDRMTQEIRRIESLLRSLKSFSMYERPETGTYQVAPFLRAFADLVSDELRRRQLGFRVEAPADCRAVFDPRALQQVLLNLFANAADALRDTPRAEIRIAAKPTDNLVSLSVADNGPGIPLEEMRNLFRPFYTTKERGTGLGLVISRKMLAKMGATIDVESNLGAGTLVTVTLPQSQPVHVP